MNPAEKLQEVIEKLNEFKENTSDRYRDTVAILKELAAFMDSGLDNLISDLEGVRDLIEYEE